MHVCECVSFDVYDVCVCLCVCMCVRVCVCGWVHVCVVLNAKSGFKCEYFCPFMSVCFSFSFARTKGGTTFAY